MVNTAPNGPESVEAAQRREALAALVARQDTPPEAEAPVVRSDREVYAGGDEPRLLIRKASTLGYRHPAGHYQRVNAEPGDVVLLTKSQAERLDRLGVTVDADSDPAEVEVESAGDLWTDDQIKVGKAGELVAYVAQHPDERPRVRLIEEARTGRRKGDGPRPSVLKATEPTPEADADAEALAAARADEGPTAEEVAETNQGNDAPGASPTGGETDDPDGYDDGDDGTE